MRFGLGLAITQLRLSGALWTPSDIITDAWYDASDDSTVTEASGAVSQLSDKSGNGFHLTQSIEADKPQTGGMIGGLNALSFLSSDQLGNVSFSVLNEQQNRSIFIVATASETDGSNNIFDLGENGVTERFSTNKYFVGFNSSNVNFDAPTPNNSTSIIEVGLDGTKVEDVFMFVNGVALTVESSVNPTSLMHTGDGLYLGKSVSGSNPSCTIGEVIVFARVLTVDERQLIEGYLAHKWGLASDLPESHPYKTSAPSESNPYPFSANVRSIINQYGDASVYPDASPLITPTSNQGASDIENGVSIDRDNAFINYYGGPAAEFGTTGIRPNFNHVESSTYSDGSKEGRGIISFRAECSEIEIILFGNGSGESYRLVIDGEVVDRNITVESANDYFYYKYDLATIGIRDFRIEGFNDFAFGGLVLSDGGDMKPQPYSNPSLVLIGDSFIVGTGATDARSGLASITAMNLGFDNYALSAFGGTGWLKDLYPGYGSTRDTMANRWQEDVIDKSPSIVIAAGGINDSSLYTSEDMLAALNDSIDLFRANMPNSILFIVAPWNTSAPTPRTGNFALMAADMESACDAYSNVILLDPDVIGYTKSDATHPDEAGHATLGAWLTAQVKLELEAMA